MPDNFTHQGESTGSIALQSDYQLPMCLVNPISCIVPYFIILFCLMPDDFIHQGKSATTQKVNNSSLN
jgi:hypothetical protein